MKTHTPLIIALIGLIAGGLYLIDLQAKQMRDTTRKHHIADIETSLYFARSRNGTYPPYNQTNWCGFLNEDSATRQQIEQALREQNEKYENPNKPFPTDPNPINDYFYVKRSPASFELYAVLETDDNNDRNNFFCTETKPTNFDYGIASVHRKKS